MVSRLEALTCASLLLCSCARSPSSSADGKSGACQLAPQSWPEADALFRRDPTWIGADAAFSIDLGQSRTLWLFGDTFLAKSSARSRKDAWFVRNTVAIQSDSYDPTSAQIAFRWGQANGSPSSFFPESGAQWSWPLSGTRLGARLVLFLLQEEQSGTGAFGFKAVGTKAVIVQNPDDDPSAWKTTDALLPTLPFPVAFGAAVVHDGDLVYAYVVREPGDHSVYIARFNAVDLLSGDASHPMLFAGGAWQPAERVTPDSIFPSQTALDLPPTELSVQKRADGTWLAVHSVGFGATQLALRTAPAPEGPWSAPCAVFTPPDTSKAGVIAYAGKAHPELAGGSVIATYATNADDATVASDMNVYFPRFVRVP